MQFKACFGNGVFDLKTSPPRPEPLQQPPDRGSPSPGTAAPARGWKVFIKKKNIFDRKI